MANLSELLGSGIRATQGAQGTQGLQGIQGLQGLKGIKGDIGVDGKHPGQRFKFASAVGGTSNPGTTKFRFDSTNPTNISYIFQNATTVDGQDLSGWFDDWKTLNTIGVGNKGYLVIYGGDADGQIWDDGVTNPVNPGHGSNSEHEYIIFRVTHVSDLPSIGTRTHFQLSVEAVSYNFAATSGTNSYTMFDNDQICFYQFYMTGTQGVQGLQGLQGLQTCQY